MSEHAQPQQEELKQHGDPLDHAENSLGGQSSKEQDTDNGGDANSQKQTSKE